MSTSHHTIGPSSLSAARHPVIAAVVSLVLVGVVFALVGRDGVAPGRGLDSGEFPGEPLIVGGMLVFCCACDDWQFGLSARSGYGHTFVLEVCAEAGAALVLTGIVAAFTTSAAAHSTDPDGS